MSVGESPWRAVIFFSQCVQITVKGVSASKSFFPRTQPPRARLVLGTGSVPVYKKHGGKGGFIALKISQIAFLSPFS